MTLAENLQKRREYCGITQQQLAEQIGVTQTSVSFFETGKKIPSVATLEQIADVLDCSTDWLLGRRTKEENRNV